MPNDEPPRTLKLNILFHGTFAFVEDKDQIHALIPQIEQHSVRAGNWLGETELAGGAYTLEGVDPVSGGPSFDRDKNLIVKSNLQDADPRRYATLAFPRPAKVASLRVADVPRTLFHDPADLVDDGPHLHIATLQVFTYDIEQAQVNKVKLATDGGGGHYWEPVLQKKKKKKLDPLIDSVNLHIFSTEDHQQQSFQDKDFDKCVKLLGADVTLKPGFVYQAGLVDPDEVPEGVDPKETEDLALRTRRMARLGRLVCQSGDANHAWYEDDALDDSTENCGSLIG